MSTIYNIMIIIANIIIIIIIIFLLYVGSALLIHLLFLFTATRIWNHYTLQYFNSQDIKKSTTLKVNNRESILTQNSIVSY